MVGAALAAIIFASPWVAVLLLTLVLAVQSLFGDGGITVMGANILNMGITGEIAAILIGFAAILILWFGASKILRTADKRR